MPGFMSEGLIEDAATLMSASQLGGRSEYILCKLPRLGTVKFEKNAEVLVRPNGDTEVATYACIVGGVGPRVVMNIFFVKHKTRNTKLNYKLIF